MDGAILVHFTPKGPNLASSDFHMFSPMKEAARRRRRRRKFSSDKEVTGAVQNWLKRQPKTGLNTETCASGLAHFDSRTKK
jgi:hypothetical protein